MSKIGILFVSYPHEDGGSMFLQNTAEYSPGYMASDFKRIVFSALTTVRTSNLNCTIIMKII
jgi:hypothetical protein